MKPKLHSDQSLGTLPVGLPVPVDDGRAAHLYGLRLPSIELMSTHGAIVDLSAVVGPAVVFAYPRTGRPGQPSLVENWDLIPGARGCTPHACEFRDINHEFQSLGYRVFGLSTQDPAYQLEMAERLHLPFPVLSDASLALTHALNLPTFEVAGQVLISRLAWIQRDGVIEHVFYPVFPPDRNASAVLDWIKQDR